MELSVSAVVLCEDSACGQASGVIIEPVKEKITHVVVAESMLPHTQRLVPIGDIESSSNQKISIQCTLHQYQKMEPLVVTRFVDGEVPTGGYEFPGPALFWPYSYEVPDTEAMVMKENLPANQLNLRRGAIVDALDGYVGEVDEFVIVPKAGCITHLVLKQADETGAKGVIIPVALIDHLTENTVYLKAYKLDLSKLPVIPLNRDWKLEEKIRHQKVFEFGIVKFEVEEFASTADLHGELDAILTDMAGVLDWVIRQDGKVAVEYDHHLINGQIIEEALSGVGYKLKHILDDADLPKDTARKILMEEESTRQKEAAGDCRSD
jgi:sporulation protein YlmC with PRC-barrel domain